VNSVRRFSFYRCFFILLGAGCVSLLFQLGVLSAGETGRDTRYYEPVEVPGDLAGPLLGRKTDQLAAFAWKDNRWQQTLLQIDERTPEGNFIFTHGKEANKADGDGRLDPQDLIIFMARHAGQAAPPGSQPPDIESILPLEMIDPITGLSRWLYLAAFTEKAALPAVKPLCEVLITPDQFLLRFPTYDYDALINYHKKEPIPTPYINNLTVNKNAGGNEKNIIDRQKVRGQISYLGGLMKFQFNEGIISGGIAAYKPGPIRVLTHSVMYPQLPLKVKGPKFFIDSILVDTLALTTTKIKIPFDPGYLIDELLLELGMDLTPEAKGMRFYNSTNPKGFLIDGKMEEEEGFDTSKDNWRLITGPQGTQIMISNIGPKLLQEGTIQTLYRDNEKEPSPPENFKGHLGAAFDSIRVKGIKAGIYNITVFGCIPEHFYDPEKFNHVLLEEILSIQDNPLEIKVGSKRIENSGGKPRMLQGVDIAN